FRIFLLILALLIPVVSEATYKIYLKNGSVISGVSSYEKKNGDVDILFKGGSIGIPENDILRIEETGAPEKDFRSNEAPATQETAPPVAAPAPGTVDKSARAAALKNDLDSVNAELGAAEADEARLVKAVNDRKSVRLSYNTQQLRQLESDIAPLQQQLSETQFRKGALMQRKATIEAELRTLQ
ncbi:MAG TPA: hypothetical protein VN328_07300, partial [Thermodesulfovibrionales bacterium]|nr:hypothetical protein [Thermodesulfovibrionales bacterium]